MAERFDYDSAREHLRENGLDPDSMPSKDPQKRDEYLRRNKIDPEQFKPDRGKRRVF